MVATIDGACRRRWITGLLLFLAGSSDWPGWIVEAGLGALAGNRGCGYAVMHVACSARFAIGGLRAGVVPSCDALVAPLALIADAGGRNGAGVSALGGDCFGGCWLGHGLIPL